MANNIKKMLQVMNNYIKEFRSYGEGDLNQFVDEYDDSLSFPKELSNVVEGFIDTLKTVSSMVENCEFIDEFRVEGEERFWDVIKNFVDNRIQAQNEISFIKDLNQDDFIELFDYVFKSYVLEYNELQEYKSYTEENIVIVIKVISTIVKMIIEELYSQMSFENTVVDLFGFSKEQIKYMWNMIINNKEELRYITLMKRIKQIEDR